MIVKRTEFIAIIVILIVTLLTTLFVVNMYSGRLVTPSSAGQTLAEQGRRLPQERYLNLPFTAEEIEKIELNWSGAMFEDNLITIIEPGAIGLIFSELEAIQFVMDMEESEWFVGGGGNTYRVILENGDLYRFTIWPCAEANPEISRVWINDGWFFTTGTMLADIRNVIELGYEEWLSYNFETNKWEPHQRND